MASSSDDLPAIGGGDNQQALSASTIVVAGDAVGSHVVMIDDGYSRRRGPVGYGKYYVKSDMFNVGGHAWCITYYPDGDETTSVEWISLHLTLIHTKDVRVDVHATLSLLDNAGEPVSPHIKSMAFMATLTDVYSMSGFSEFMERKDLQESPYLIDGCFRVRCDVTVKNYGGARSTRQLISMPPSDMHRHIGGLLSSQEGVDVTFEVDGETFGAHRLVLAARSSVFKAELFGPIKEKSMSHIRIDDMEARVFKAMLHFIYNDDLPEIDNKDDMPAMAQHLLVAADRYGLDRLKLICEDKLWYNINTRTLSTTLALAEQHGCLGLKDACFEFLKTSRNLKAVMESDESYQHLMNSFPSFHLELAAKLAL